MVDIRVTGYSLGDYVPQVEIRVESEKRQNFGDILKEKCREKIMFSKHANERIGERNINVDDEVSLKLSDAADQARAKGLNNVLVLIGDNAFIVNTAARKVITAAGQNDLKESIFTNIDGAVIK